MGTRGRGRPGGEEDWGGEGAQEAEGAKDFKSNSE